MVQFVLASGLELWSVECNVMLSTLSHISQDLATKIRMTDVLITFSTD